MSGGKKTPRQKMIEMMYLVLTALLALNVSKEIISAFITINGKLDSSSQVISQSNSAIYGTFDSKRAALTLQKGDMANLDYWQGKADNVNLRTKQIISFILSEANEAIETLEKKDWTIRDENGYVTGLESLLAVKNMDNYDQTTRMFVGSNPNTPNKRGMALLDSVNTYRNNVSELMGNYKIGSKEYSFVAPEDPLGLNEALKTANPADTAEIGGFYRSMTIPGEVEIKNGAETVTYPWPAAMFNHTPLVAAVAIFTSLKLDILNAENHAANFMLAKVDAPTFNFNKIEPLAFARTGYINAGDSLELRIMIAAYDSTDVPPIRYGINDSTPGNWKETEGSINLDGSTPGTYRATGVIGVKVKGETKYKPWEFNYTVGKPTGTVSLPEMNVLYRGYDNKVEGAASGFPGYSLSGGGNVSLSKSGKFYIAKPGSGREASINIAGVAEDGSTTSLGKFQFRVRNLPKPDIIMGGARGEDGIISSGQLKVATALFARYPDDITLNANFAVTSWEIHVSSSNRPVNGRGAQLSPEARRAMSNAARGDIITVSTAVSGPGPAMRKNVSFKVK